MIKLIFFTLICIVRKAESSPNSCTSTNKLTSKCINDLNDKNTGTNNLVVDGRISGMHFTSIDVSPFSDQRILTNLSITDQGFDYNFIVGVFYGLTNLESLQLNRDSIYQFNFGKPGCFTGIGSSLKNLDISQNRIKELNEDTFGNLPNIHDLDLHNNELRSIHAYAFKYLNKLIKLNLHNNYISKLGENSLYGLESIEIIILTQNNWIDGIFDVIYTVFEKNRDIYSSNEKDVLFYPGGSLDQVSCFINPHYQKGNCENFRLSDKCRYPNTYCTQSTKCCNPAIYTCINHNSFYLHTLCDRIHLY